ncbi:protein FAR1-RELATED SEQUENCE 5-like isoform X2 [Phragmites australis]|uniref:protein FAR1-RELATED SEQUENCE 5-like isoform X2 n=1 Tax=Phragmites australis TaxID=29695 RepID=UPI002D76C386|nr:protein FAR1-RELATED SEQUENCE 5-like isoform X2 [Phragmites australis]
MNHHQELQEKKQQYGKDHVQSSSNTMENETNDRSKMRGLHGVEEPGEENVAYPYSDMHLGLGMSNYVCRDSEENQNAMFRTYQNYNDNDKQKHHMNLAHTQQFIEEHMQQSLFTTPPYLSGANTTYTGMMEEIISSQEERRLQKAWQDDNISFTHLLLGNNNYEEFSAFTQQEREGEREDGNWQIDIFDNLQIEQVQRESIDEGQSSAGIATSTSIESDTGTLEQATYSQINNDEQENGSQEITEEQIESFLKSELLAASEGNNADIDSKYTPVIGQEFKTKDEAHHYFSFYAFLAGFKVVITHTVRTTSRKKNNEIFKQEMKCNKYGKESKKKNEKEEQQEEGQNANKGPKRNTNVDIKTDCPVVMVVKETNGIWRVTRLDLDHNHALSPGSRNQLFSGHKYMTEMEKSLIRTLNNNNIETRKMIAILSCLRGGVTVSPYDKKAISNFRTKINREVSGNDLMQTFEYFRKKQSEDRAFFFKFDLDEDKKVKNMFWSDSSSVQYYADYGDLVSFDTTFLTNRYNLPCSPFVGITGHGQTCLFGCAFLSDERTETFTWVFETFLEAMGGKNPKTIITDQDGAMRSAIKKVFPNSIHRNCLFHIKKKCYDKNIKVFGKKDNENLCEEFEDIVNNSVTREEFETLWQQMITNYKLENNKYFNKMWQMRDRFIPVFFKENFCPFLQSTAISEGTNSRFKNNIGPTYSIMSFLKEYQRIVDTINSSEAFEDSISREKRPKELWGEYYIEKQGQEMYNRKIFRKFQLEVKATSRLSYKEKEEGKIYEVYQKPNHPQKEYRPRKYVVITDLKNEDFSCICGKFQKDGILCSHILKVIVEEDISRIPEKYILERWRKKDKRVMIHRTVGTKKSHQLLRFNVLSRKSALLSSKGSYNDDTCDYLVQEFDRIEKDLDSMINNEARNIIPEDELESSHVMDLTAQSISDNITGRNQDEADFEILDPDRIKQKGRPPKPRRLKTFVEEKKEKLAKEAEQNERKIAKQNERKKMQQQSKHKKDESTSPNGKTKKKRKKGSGISADNTQG